MPLDKYLFVLLSLLSPLLLAAALPDLAAVDKLFAEKRYAEALKGYASCEVKGSEHIDIVTLTQ